MKLQNKSQVQFVIASFINCLAIIIGLILYSSNMQVKYTALIGIVILLLILNIISLIFGVRVNSYIKQIEDKLELLEKVSEATPNAIFVHRKLEFTYLNKKAAQVFGVEDPKDIIGKPVEDYIKFNIPVVGQERYAAAKEGKFFEPVLEEKFFRANGEVIDMEITGTPIEVKGDTYALVLCKNVTEQKQILELKQKIYDEEMKLREKIKHDKIKDEFFANLSHELRTPLTIILSIMQLVEKREESMSHQTDKNFIMLKQNCFRLLRLINNLLDITKIDSGYFQITMDKYNIVSVVEDITSSVVEYIENKGLHIIFDTEVEEKIVSCHVDSMDRVILNLLANAVKFTSDGGNIFVNIYDEVDNVKIVIRDTGIGIKEENIDFIFDRFRQVDKSFTRNHEGSGIGLSIVKSLVEMQGGTIEVQSEYGKGSEFIIKLPVEYAAKNQTVNTTVKSEASIKQKINIEFSDI